MLWKLQRATLIPTQIVGYSFTLLLGLATVLVTIQLYLDVQPLLFEETDVFKDNSAVISKHVTMFKSLHKEKLYFTQEELKDIKNQPFVKDVSTFNSATYRIMVDLPMFRTDAFFESIPDKYIDVKTDEWQWDSTNNFVPVIVPEDFLNLYNFGYAESRGLPVISKNTISQLAINLVVSGNQKSDRFKSQVVGFSKKINSVLVPQAFMHWANKIYGRGGTPNTSRILIEFSNPADEAILSYFDDKGYAINKEKLEFSKLVFFFKSVFIFIFFLAMTMIVIATAFILMSVNLILQKNKELFINLHLIGYSPQLIARFYQIVISFTTLLAGISSIIIGYFARRFYMTQFNRYFEIEDTTNILLTGGPIILISLLILYNLLLIRNTKKIITS